VSSANTDQPAAAHDGHGQLRVLVVMPLGEALGGGEEMLRQLLREGRSADIEWSVAFLRHGPLVAEVRGLGITCHVIEAGRFRQLGRRVTAVMRLARLAQESEVDLMFGWMVAGQAMAGPAALLAGIPSAWYQVATAGGDWLDRFANVWPARGVITLSRAGADAQARAWPRRPVHLVHPGVSLAAGERVRALDPVALRGRLGLPAAGRIVGMVGRLQRWKGVHVFLDAVAELHGAEPAIRAVVVGGEHETEPGYPAELRAQAVRLGIAYAVTFAGFQSNALEWMQAMDVVVHASDHEPFGIVVIEAMALGKPVVAGAAGGPAEIITDGVHGLLTPFGDSAALARAIQRLLADPGLATRLGGAAQRRAAEFSDAAYAANVIAALRLCIFRR